MAGPPAIVFFGSDTIALPLLKWLAGEGREFGRIQAVFTQPDRAAGRGQGVRPNGIKLWAEAHSLPVHQPERLGEPERRTLADLGPDLGLVMAYGHILRDEVISIPRLGMLNLHASLLPSYRGASPIQAAIASGDRETGVSLMRIVRRLDAGPVADRESVPIGARDTAADVEDRLSRACIPLLARALPVLARGALAFAEQDEKAASYCRKLVKEDGVLDFSAKAAALAARINGLFPWPGCSFPIAGAPIRVGLAEPAETAGGAVPGTVLGTDAEGLLVATGEGAVRLLRLQRPGGRMLSAPEFLRGFPIPAGTVLPSAPMPPLVEKR